MSRWRWGYQQITEKDDNANNGDTYNDNNEYEDNDNCDDNNEQIMMMTVYNHDRMNKVC